MKNFFVFAYACFASLALSAQNPDIKSSSKSVNSSSKPAASSAQPVKSESLQMEAMRPKNPLANPAKSDEVQKQTPANQAKPNHKKRTKLEANKNLKSVKKGFYQTAPETKQSK